MSSETMAEFDNPSDIKRSDFPDDFMFGVGTSAYQVEGGWRAGGKGFSIWDCFSLRHPNKINGGANGCHTDENYSRMKEDVQLLKKMGVRSYRFSISWPRILPGGKISMGKSMEGINHYNKLIDELLANDIEPFVTLFHWDLPNALEEEYMGFLSSKIVEDFASYADLCFWEFGDRVKNWVTLNEPHKFTTSGYVEGIWAPGRGGGNEDGDSQTEPYIVAYNLLCCHAVAYRKYYEDYKDTQKGKVGITLDCMFFQPFRGPDNQQDVQAVNYAFDFEFGWFMEPLTKVRDSDNKYIGQPSFEGSWVYLCPHQLTELLVYIKGRYKVAKEILITENGSSDKNETGKTYEQVRNDAFRVNYIKEHLKAIKQARDLKVNVTGYFIWSFMDSFEWSSGYSIRFGMIYVDFLKDLQRYPKKSALWFKKFLGENKKIPAIDVERKPRKAEQASEASQKLKKART